MNGEPIVWFAILGGGKFDLDCCERFLKAPFDPACESKELAGTSVLCLRSSKFSGLGTAEEVKPVAELLIDRLNGALRVQSGTQPLTIKGIVHVGGDGQLQLTNFGTLNVVLENCMLTATGVVQNADGTTVPAAAPPASPVQKWIGAAEGSDDIADLLLFAGRADNWIDVYKACEAAENVAGKKGLKSVMGSEASATLRLIKRTANMHRHARLKEEPPSVPMTFNEAATHLRSVLLTVLAHTGY